MAGFPPHPAGGRYLDKGMKKESIEETARLIELRDACAQCSDEAQFAAMARRQLQPLLPHGSLIAAIVRISPAQLRLVHAIALNHPAEVLARMPRELDLADRPALKRWLDSGEPQILALPGDAGRMSAREQCALEALGLRRVALHGRIDLGGIVGSCFCFGNLGDAVSPPQALDRLRLVIPPLHEALMRAWRRERPMPRRPPAVDD